MTEEEPRQETPVEVQHDGLPEPYPEPPHDKRFWTKRRVIICVVAFVVVLLMMCGCVGFSVWRFVSTEAQTMKTMRGFVDAAYPAYRVVDSTRSGYILQHGARESLRLDVRFTAPDMIGVWEDAPQEKLTADWATAETFFRHAAGMPQDPRTNMNYDVDGFVEAYSPLRPGPNSVVSAVWLQDTDSAGVETYVVLVARRNRDGQYVEDMWPDHRALFKRDSKSGTWTGAVFEPVEIANTNE